MTHKINADLLETTMEYIEAHPEEHDQGTWRNRCSTAFCFAGHAAILAGAESPKVLANSTDYWYIDTDGKAVADREEHPRAVHVQEYARAALGLNYPQTPILFHSDNTVYQLRAMVDKLIADPDADLTDCWD